MYEVDELDKVVELKDLPQSNVGAPIPLVISDEQHTVLAYYLQKTPPDWSGEAVRVLGMDDADEPIGIVRFNFCYASMFGPPNDEAFSGHPLASRGLGPYGTYRIESSSWIRRLERMNSVHEYHQPERFSERHHFVWSFHDSTFECICNSYDFKLAQGSIESVIPEMKALFKWDAR